MQRKIYFRADGNATIGLGHVTRCLALADMLTEYFDCLFLAQNPAESVMAQIRERHALICLPQTTDYLAEAGNLSKEYFSKDSIVVLDGYEFRTDYQRTVKGSGSKLVCIDDLHAWHFVADAVINQAGGVERTAYSCETSTQLCLGPGYALLREPFLAAARQRKPLTGRDGLFICFGGADPENLTARAVKAAVEARWRGKVIAVTGATAAQSKELAALQQVVPSLELYRNVNAETMVSLMQRCAVAMAPASGISYEIASVGLHFITGHYVDNQKYLYRYLVDNGLALAADEFQEEKLVELLSGDVWAKPGILEQQEKWFAGKSFRHLRKVFIKLALQARRASLKDMRTYFDWANEPETRANSLNQTPIVWPRHQVWFAKRVDDPNFFFYLFCLGEMAIGQVRFELVENIATISYSVDENFRGLGLGFEIIALALKKLGEESTVRTVQGVVKNDNPASLAIFDKIGFRIVQQGNASTHFERTVQSV